MPIELALAVLQLGRQCNLSVASEGYLSPRNPKTQAT